jgi:hypothetical protein
MEPNNSDLIFLSNWDIDQLLEAGTVNVSSNPTTVYSYTGNLPTFELQFQPAGDTKWYDAGANTTNGTTTNLFWFYGSAQNGTISIYAYNNSGNQSGTARYFIWADKVEY